MYYSHKLRITNPGVSWTVPGVKKLVKSMILLGLTFLSFYGRIKEINYKGVYYV